MSEPLIERFTPPPRSSTAVTCSNSTSTRRSPTCSGPVYKCTQCSLRMCEPCILHELDKSRSPHEATHEVQELHPSVLYNFTRFAQKQLSYTFVAPPKTSLTRAFVSSHHAFIPSCTREKMLILNLELPPGSYNLGVRLYTQSHHDKIVNLQLIDRLFRKEDIHCDGVNLGRIAVTTLTDAEKTPAWSRATYINVAKGNAERVERQIVTNYSLQVQSVLRVCLRYSYDGKFFTRGAPFSWWLHELTVSREGELYRIATKEQVQACLYRQTTRHELELAEHRAERKRLEEREMARRVQAQREIARIEDQNDRIRMAQLARENQELRREHAQLRREQQRRALRLREEMIRERRIDEEMMRGQEVLRVHGRRGRRRLGWVEEVAYESGSSGSFSISSDSD